MAARPGPLRPPWAGWLRAVAVPVVVTAWGLRSLVHPGYVLQVDAIFGPIEPWPSWGLGAPMTLLIHLLGGVVASRVCVGGALLLCGLGPMVLLRRRSWVVQLPAGLLGMLNPFVYGRLVQGQWGVAGAAGMLFLWLAAWDGLQRRPGWRPALRCALSGFGAAAFDPHSLGMLVALAALALLWQRAWRDGRRLAWSAASFGVLGVGLLYGVVPFFLGHGGGSYTTVQHFGRADLVAFRSAASPRYGLWVNLLGLYGFWPERLGRIPLLRAGAGWWPLTTLVLVLLAGLGAWARRERAWVVLAGGVGLLIAGSTATGPGQAAFLWLMVHVPLVGAYREPQKWSALWLVALVVGGAEAVTWLGRRSPAGGRRGPALGNGAAAVMVLATLFPAGAAAIRELPATVTPFRYPASWTGAAAYLGAHVSPRAPVVVLPWHLYQPLAFAGDQLIANPAPVVFPGRLISPNDLEIPGAVTEVATPDHLTEAALDPTASPCRLARALRRLHAGWAVVEPGQGARADSRALLGCGWRIRFGRVRGLAVLEG